MAKKITAKDRRLANAIFPKGRPALKKGGKAVRGKAAASSAG